MDVLQHLGVALGFATLAGLNLYLTVFATSLAIHNGWIVLSPQYHDLAILDNPFILYLSGALFFIQFFADKIPWVDSAWDVLHTAIRPIGGAFLAIRALGQPDPIWDVIIGIIAGGVTFTTHGAKASARLLANGSPEPFSNIALSLTEDATVVGGLAVMSYSYHHYPWLSLAVFSTFFAILLIVIPRVLRFARVRMWLFWKKLTSPATSSDRVELPKELPVRADILFHEENILCEKIAWAVPCLTAGSKGLPSNTHGWLIATVESPQKLIFVGRRTLRKIARTLELAGYKVAHEPKFLSENLSLYGLEKQPRHDFVFDRSQARLVRALAESLRERLQAPPPSMETASPAAAERQLAGV